MKEKALGNKKFRWLGVDEEFERKRTTEPAIKPLANHYKTEHSTENKRKILLRKTDQQTQTLKKAGRLGDRQSNSKGI